MRNLYIFAFFTMMVCMGCQWHLKPSDEAEAEQQVVIERFDRMESLYLSTGDIAALQQMKTAYPVQTRTLIEDVLKLGQVDESDINTRFLMFFQDSTLQALMRDVETQYTDIDDVNNDLNRAFKRLANMLPTVSLPTVYTQIGSLDQSIVVGNGQLGISLDKYLGDDYPFYIRYGYTDEQRSMMTRQFIVPDCIGFFLLSLYPAPEDRVIDHSAKIQYVVNKVIGRKVFKKPQVKAVESFMLHHPNTSVDALLTSTDLIQ